MDLQFTNRCGQTLKHVSKLPDLVYKFIEHFIDAQYSVIILSIHEISGRDERYYFGQYDKQSENDAVRSILSENPNTNFNVSVFRHSNLVAKLNVVYLEENTVKLFVTFELATLFENT